VVSIIIILSIALIAALYQRRKAIEAEVETKEQLRKNYWANALDSKEKNVKIATGTELDDYGNITVLSKT
jgi:hypothetical protein